MATVAKPKPITAEDFLDMDLGEGIYELVRGEVVEMPMPMPEHGRYCMNSAFDLESFGRRTGFGYTLSNDSYVITGRGPDTVRGGDVCFYSNARWPREKLGKGLIPVPPDLVVEVLSPSNRPGEIRRKVYEYLDAGVLMVWVIDPERRRMLLFRPNDLEARIYRETDAIEDLPELPDFRCVVADFFA